MPDDPLATYKPEEIAVLWHVSERLVLDLVAARRLAHLRIGPRTIRITRAQLEAFVAENSVPVQPVLAVVPNIRARRAA